MHLTVYQNQARGAQMATIAELVHDQAGDHGTALMAGDRTWTHDQVARAAAARAALLADLLPAGAHPHVGVLLDNVPEFPLWLEGAALSGATLVGVNATRRGADLARDITHTDCSVLVTDRAHRPLVAGLDLGIPDERVLVVDDPAYPGILAPYRDAALPGTAPDPATRLLIVFTSGSTGAPKGVVCSQGRLANAGTALTAQFGFDRDSVHYICMPMFHGNALMANWAPALRAKGAVALRRRFSASAFLDDVRRFGATYFTYVGRAVSYLLATPERPDDADNPLRGAFGTEAGGVDMRRFERRFGVRLTEGYGSSEGGMSVTWRPGTPDRAIGPCPRNAALLDPETGEECPRAVFDTAGRLLNGDAAIGELVNLGRNGFEGYWRNAEADRARTRDGRRYWSGDFFYRDEAGYLYFAARGDDKVRVDGENLSVAGIEDILARFAPVDSVVVYAVPDPVAGDQVMAALHLRPGAEFVPGAFDAFLAAQDDLGTKMAPRFVRVVDRVPVTATNKVDRVGLRRAGFRTAPVWWRPERGAAYREFTTDDRTALLAVYAEHARDGELDV
ncbi:AMP-binding protein [Yinghuangia sp. ASG 101]|uniref:AMP-binding protein n=1 Tax=Yinghuangia sp. ASG 101 TaxID=2896848 RepID=UPI001E5465CB|nr:AMP-binding protein [Yinghuangia sp. ASG 101]UGQ15470.1 AMP-binding protein [Yinghuangia sp. ASG 101]